MGADLNRWLEPGTLFFFCNSFRKLALHSWNILEQLRYWLDFWYSAYKIQEHFLGAFRVADFEVSVVSNLCKLGFDASYQYTACWIREFGEERCGQMIAGTVRGLSRWSYLLTCISIQISISFQIQLSIILFGAGFIITILPGSGEQFVNVIEADPEFSDSDPDP